MRMTLFFYLKLLKDCNFFLHKLEDFCIKWNLKVNILDKTKIIIFNKSGRVLKGYNFFYGNNLIEHANHYKYLHVGIYFRSSCVFNQALSIFAIRRLKLSSVSGKLLCQNVHV